MHHTPAGRLVTAVATVAALGLLVVAAAAFLFLAVGPHVLDYRAQPVADRSLGPAAGPGDVVVTRPVAARDLRAGDLISAAARTPGGSAETRLVSAVTRGTDGRIRVVTRGEGPLGPGPRVATLDGETAWRATAVVPHLGAAVDALQAPFARRYGAWVVLAGLLVAGLALLRRAPGGVDRRPAVAVVDHAIVPAV